jgi:hypothetical protein
LGGHASMKVLETRLGVNTELVALSSLIQTFCLLPAGIKRQPWSGMVEEGEVEHYTDVTLKQERPLLLLFCV